MKNLIMLVLRVIVLVVLYTVLFTAASTVTGPPEIAQLMTPEQVSLSTLMLPVLSLVMTLMLTYLAIRSRWHGWKLAGALFVISYGLHTFLGQIEILAFPAVSSQMPPGSILGFLISGLIVTGPFSIMATWVLGKSRPEPTGGLTNDRLQMSASEWVWKLAAAAVLYVIVYFTFGYFVAWRTPGLPEFYSGTDPGTFTGQLANVMRGTPWLPAFQLLRGLIWAGIGCIIIRMHKGSAWETALATGLAFSVLMNAALLFPNPFMPDYVARAHAIELVASNFVYGILLALLMLWEPTGVKRPAGQTRFAH